MQYVISNAQFIIICPLRPLFFVFFCFIKHETRQKQTNADHSLLGEGGSIVRKNKIKRRNGFYRKKYTG